jgi:hypothetical protein
LVGHFCFTPDALALARVPHPPGLAFLVGQMWRFWKGSGGEVERFFKPKRKIRRATALTNASNTL